MVVRRKTLKPIDFDGLRIHDYTADMNSSSSLASIDVPPRARHPEAWSKRSDKYYLVTAGSISFVLDGELLELSAGDFCLIRQGQRFSYYNEASNDASLILFHTPAFRLEDDVFLETE